MKKKNYSYDEASGCLAPPDSAEYAAWLYSLPPGLRSVMVEELEQRASEKQKTQHGKK